MPPAEPIRKTATTDGAQLPSPDSLAQAVDNAFETEDSTTDSAAADTDEILLNAAPTLPDREFENLQQEVSHTRVIFVRGAAAISITAIISISGALLFHFLAVGGFLLALFLTVTHPGGSGNGDLGSRSAGSNGGSVIVGDGPQGPAQIATSVNVLLNHASPPPVPTMPVLPDVTTTSTDPRQVAAAELEGAEPVMIGIPSSDSRIGVPRPITPPRLAIPRPTPPKSPRNDTLVVSPPPREPQRPENNSTVIVASAGNNTQSPSSLNSGMGAGGDDDPFGHEMTISGAKDGDGSDGNGAGNGGGINRGASAANNPVPAILEWDLPHFSDTIGFNPPIRSTNCRVLVLANGHAGKVDIIQSCGQPALDQKCVDSLMKAKFRPAYRNGKPYDAPKDVGLNYGNH